jgi:DNA-binding CsgD family transcriptional regulator/PAS domain-containing protein
MFVLSGPSGEHDVLDDSDVVEQLYACVADIDAFASIPEFLARHLKADSAWLISDVALDGAAAPSLDASYGFDDDLLRAYFGGGYRGDPWLAAAPEVPLGRGFALDRIVSATRFEMSPVYNELVRGRSDIRHCMALAVNAEDRLHAIALQRNRRTSRFMDDDETALSALAAPLARVMATRRRRVQGLGRNVGDTALDTALDAVILCDRVGGIQYRNPAAEWLLTVGYPVQRSMGQRVAGCGREGVSLARAIAGAADKGLTSRICIGGGERGRFIIRVEADPAESHLAIIIVRDVEAHTARVIDDSARAYSFTPAEAALAHSLVQGRSLEDHADQRELRISTVRTQLRALLAKTGTVRQGQMISMLLSDPPAMSHR